MRHLGLLTSFSFFQPVISLSLSHFLCSGYRQFVWPFFAVCSFKDCKDVCPFPFVAVVCPGTAVCCCTSSLPFAHLTRRLQLPPPTAGQCVRRRPVHVLPRFCAHLGSTAPAHPWKLDLHLAVESTELALFCLVSPVFLHQTVHQWRRLCCYSHLRLW